jgi:hypothetical protein
MSWVVLANAGWFLKVMTGVVTYGVSQIGESAILADLSAKLAAYQAAIGVADKITDFATIGELQTTKQASGVYEKESGRQLLRGECRFAWDPSVRRLLSVGLGHGVGLFRSPLPLAGPSARMRGISRSGRHARLCSGGRDPQPAMKRYA